MKLLFALFVTCCVSALTPLGVQAQKAKLAPLPLEESLNALRFGFSPISVCPTDQRWIVYQLRNVKRPDSVVGKYGYSTSTGVPVSQTDGDIWITDIDSGASKNLTEGKGSNWAAVWSPNGEYLAFYSDRSGQANLWVWERSTGKLRQVSNVAPRPYIFSPYDLPIWTPDGKSVLVKTFPEGTVFPLVSRPKTSDSEQPSKTPKAIDITVFSSNADPQRAESPVPWATGALSANDLSEAAADLSLIQISTGKVERLATGYTPAGYWMSPDGEDIAFLNVTGKKDNWSLFDLVVVSLSSKRKQIVTSGIQQTIFGLSVGWVPDSKRLIYLSTGDWFSVSANGGVPRKLTQTPDQAVAFSLPQTDVWDSSGDSFYFVANNSVRKVSLSTNSTIEIAKLPQKRLMRIVAPRRAGPSWSPDKMGFILIATRDEQNKQAGFFRIDLASGKATQLIQQNMDFGDFPTPQIEVAQSFGSILYITEDAQHCKDIWIAKTDFSAPPRRVTNGNPLFDEYMVGESRLIEWSSDDGVKLRGALLLPAGYRTGTRYPLVVNVYGGEIMSNRINHFGFSWSPVLNMQLLATRGYAVLLPDTILRPGTPMTDIAKCVLPGVNKVIEMGIADPDKLAVMGSSYGGYSALALVVQTARFKAAISDAGPTNLIGIYSHLMRSGEAGYIGWAESGRGNMGGSLWKYRERYIENSPLFYLDRVQTPILILQGTDDEATPTFLADELFSSLKRLGKEVTYVRYNGEGHTLQNYSRAGQIDHLTRVFTWLDTWVKGLRTEPEISKQ